MAAEQPVLDGQDLDRQAEGLGERLAAHFQQVFITAMSDVPIMNVALAPLAGDAAQGRSGDTISVALPVGQVDFLIGDLAGFGRLLTCSLFSPMDAFEDQAAALA